MNGLRIKEDGSKYYVIEIHAEVWENMVREGLISSEFYMMIDEKIRNEGYPDVAEWAKLKSKSTNAYKELQELTMQLRNTAERSQRDAT